MDIQSDLLKEYNNRLTELNTQLDVREPPSPSRQYVHEDTSKSIVDKIWSERYILLIITLCVLVVFMYLRPFKSKEEVRSPDGKVVIKEHTKIVPTLLLGFGVSVILFGTYIYMFKKK